MEAMEWSGYGPVLNTKDAARLLQLHEESLRVFAREGKVPCHRFPPRAALPARRTNRVAARATARG